MNGTFSNGYFRTLTVHIHLQALSMENNEGAKTQLSGFSRNDKRRPCKTERKQRPNLVGQPRETRNVGQLDEPRPRKAGASPSAAAPAPTSATWRQPVHVKQKAGTTQVDPAHEEHMRSGSLQAMRLQETT